MTTEYTFPVISPVASDGGASMLSQIEGTGDFGSDIACTGDLDSELRLLGGRAVLVQDLLHRLETPRGGLWYDLSYGYDLRELLHQALSPADLAAIAPTVRAQFLLDERVFDCNVSPQFFSSERRLVLRVTAFDNEGPFSLALSVNSVSVELLEVQ